MSGERPGAQDVPTGQPDATASPGEIEADDAGRSPHGPSADEDASPAGNRVHELEEQLRYALADLDNLRKRFAREVERERLAERERASRPWLPVLDSLDLALTHADEGMVAGIESLRNGALSAIAEAGFPRFDDTGKPFDPDRHEAVSTVESDDAPGIIVSTVRPGYGAETVLRPASVIVSRKPTSG